MGANTSRVDPGVGPAHDGGGPSGRGGGAAPGGGLSTIEQVFATQGQLFCVARPSGQECGRLLRDATGCQVRDEVSCSRRECQHIVCTSCLLQGVLKAARRGEVYMCPVEACGHRWCSWDTRSREDGSGAGGKRKRGEAEVFRTEQGTWGLQPEAYLQPRGVRKFYRAHPPPKECPPERGYTPPKVGEFAFAVSAGVAKGGGSTWDAVFPGPTGNSPADVAARQRNSEALRVLGRELRGSIVKDGKASFPVVGSAAQVDFGHISTAAIQETTAFGGFMRALCSGSDEVITPEEFRNAPEKRKTFLAAWSSAQTILGRQYPSGSPVVGRLQAFLAWGQAVMDKTPFGAHLRSLGSSLPRLS